ncbi:MAG: MBL fold metallo-hydrolase [Clostridia bacterium]|nr:MBL fold metallo-hydrolase [Clostridia bacterium]
MAVFYLLGNVTRTQMLGCIVQANDKTVVFDGGTVEDCPQLAHFLRTNANSHVDAWFFTHPHHDHIGAFCTLRRQAPDILVERAYFRFPPIEELKRHEPRSVREVELWEDIEKWGESCRIHILSRRERFVFDDVTISVLRVYEGKHVDTENFINNSSAVYRVENDRHSFLILGDLGKEGGEELMQTCPCELLQTDYTQMAHHGQRGVTREFYEYIRPKRCIWPTPEWLWNNDKGKGFDTGPWQTVRTREWMAELGVTEHFIEKDGTQKINF